MAAWLLTGFRGSMVAAWGQGCNSTQQPMCCSVRWYRVCQTSTVVDVCVTRVAERGDESERSNAEDGAPPCMCTCGGGILPASV